MFITQGVHRWAKMTPDKPALVFGDRVTTYGALQERVAKVAGAIAGLNSAPGDRVAILALNSDKFIELMLGAVWAGLVPNNLNLRWAIPELAFAINDSGATLLAVDKVFAGHVAPLRENCPTLKAVVYLGEESAPDGMLSFDQLVDQAHPLEDQCTDTHAMAVLNYTGGTTGRAKGVMLSHSNLVNLSAYTLMDSFFIQGAKLGLVTPLFHISGIAVLLINQFAGNTIVVQNMFEPVATLKLLQDHGVEQTFLIPVMIQMLVDHPEFDQYDLSKLRYLRYGGSSISEALLRRVLNKLPHTGLAQVYGQTEMVPVTFLQEEDHTLQGMERGVLRSAGKPTSFCEVRVVDTEDKEQLTGQIGEVAFRGLHAMMGYWNRPDLTASTLRNGWVHSGDVGHVDAEGYLYVVDRLKDMIITGGENVYSSEVENAIAKHPAVQACAVIAIPDDQWGELVHAVVVLKPEQALTEEALQEHCRPLIASYKVPRSFEFRDALPLTAANKINKVVLREPHWKGREHNAG